MTREPAPLAADRLASRRDHLMHETTPHPYPSARRIKILVGGLLATAVIGGGTVAVAGTPAVFHMDNNVVGVDTAQLTQMHYGNALSLAQVEELNKDGKAMFTLNSPELACHGVTIYVDTQAEADAYGEGYAQRSKAASTLTAAQGAAAANGDPCTKWTAPVPELTARR